MEYFLLEIFFNVDIIIKNFSTLGNILENPDFMVSLDRIDERIFRKIENLAQAIGLTQRWLAFEVELREQFSTKILPLERR